MGNSVKQLSSFQDPADIFGRQLDKILLILAREGDNAFIEIKIPILFKSPI
jgi:hypothetical protein